ncbi:MAG: PDZ domain-containing protein [Burkholderiaceae bacterium]|jgi:predicted metalloprotease with PDZ domain|nr:PDZ domain-containing protein [Burkholderiaceae bacterium]
MENAVHYTIVPSDPAGHYFTVTLTITSPDPQGQRISMPTWIPGSYLIREFARHVVRIRATSNGHDVMLEKQNKHTWQLAPCRHALQVEYDIYAWDLSVRAAHLDQSHAFFNGSSVYLRAEGKEHHPHITHLQRPRGSHYRTWQVATTLREYEAKRYGFGSYIADNYDELIDHPVEMGNFALGSFSVCHTPHDVAITGHVPALDMDRLCADLSRLCETHITFFAPATKQAPMARYLFLVTAAGNAYGGLEHRSSTALLCSRTDLPSKQTGTAAPTSEAYQTFLALCSHEYFHNWLVKRIRPGDFSPYNLQEENYTRLLWLFEGFTSYYDDLLLVRSALIDEDTYLRRLARTINRVKSGSGRHKQSIAEASFDAWIKFYRQDENAPNALVNYYTKGALIALALDLTIRRQTRKQKSLDDVLLRLWEKYAHHFEKGGKETGLDEAEVLPLFEDATGVMLGDFFKRYIYGTEDPPLEALLKFVGIEKNQPDSPEKPGLNIRVRQTHGDCLIANVSNGGAAHKAGLSAGDILLAIDNVRIQPDPPATLDNLLSRYAAGDTVKVHLFRLDELLCKEVTLLPDNQPQFTLKRAKKQTATTRTARQQWLGTP